MGVDHSRDPMDLGKMKCVAETEKALKVEGKLRDGKVGQLWCPKSVLHDASKVRKMGDEGKFIIFTWWGEKNLE